MSKTEVSKEVYEKAGEDNRSKEVRTTYLHPDTGEEMGTIGWFKEWVIEKDIEESDTRDLKAFVSNEFVDEIQEDYDCLRDEAIERAYASAKQKNEVRYSVLNVEKLNQKGVLEAFADSLINVDSKLELIEQLAEAEVTFQDLLDELKRRCG